MANELARRGSVIKAGAIACLGGSILSFVFVSWILGVILLGGACYLGRQLIKNYAERGKRF